MKRLQGPALFLFIVICVAFGFANRCQADDNPPPVVPTPTLGISILTDPIPRLPSPPPHTPIPPEPLLLTPSPTTVPPTATPPPTLVPTDMPTPAETRAPVQKG